MTVQEMIKEAYTCAASKGFWDGVDPIRSIPTQLALIHSEASEILEDYRAGKTELALEKACSCSERSSCCAAKPVGLPSELADVAIRVFCLVGALGSDWTAYFEVNKTKTKYMIEHREIPERVARIHQRISSCLGSTGRDLIEGLGHVVESVYSLAVGRCDLDEVIAQKMKYNRTRPYRHGGKLC